MKKQEVVILVFPHASDKSVGKIQSEMQQHLSKAMPDAKFYYTNAILNTMSLEDLKKICEFFLEDLAVHKAINVPKP